MNGQIPKIPKVKKKKRNPSFKIIKLIIFWKNGGMASARESYRQARAPLDLDREILVFKKRILSS